MRTRHRVALWSLAAAFGLLGGAVFCSRRSKRERSLGVMNGAHPVTGASVPLRDELPHIKRDKRGANAHAERPTPSIFPGSNDETRAPMLEPAKPETFWPGQEFRRPAKTTDWIIAISLLVLSLTAAYYTVMSTGRNRYRPQASAIPATLAVTDKAGQAEQQAWVGLLLPTASPLSREGGGFAIKLRNFGQTPALKVLIADNVVIEDLDQPSGAQATVPDRSPMAAGTLMPGSEFATDIGFRTTPEGIISLAQGKVRAVNYALITYEDIYHRRHTTRSCFYWHGGLHTPLPCQEFNTVE